MSLVFKYLNNWDRMVKKLAKRTAYLFYYIGFNIEKVSRKAWFWLLRKQPEIVYFQNIDIPISGTEIAVWVEVKNASHLSLNGIVYSSKKNIFFLSESDQSNDILLVVYGYSKNKVLTRNINRKMIVTKIPKLEYNQTFESLNYKNSLSFGIKLPKLKLQLNKVTITEPVAYTTVPDCTINTNTNLYYQIYDQQRAKRKL
jgi:hypothetical protein